VEEWTKWDTGVALWSFKSATLKSFVEPWPLFGLLIFYTVGRTPLTGDQPVSRPLRAHTDIHASNGIRTHDPSVWAGGDSSYMTGGSLHNNNSEKNEIDTTVSKICLLAIDAICFDPYVGPSSGVNNCVLILYLSILCSYTFYTQNLNLQLNSKS
jgi:hypothetical protein